MRANGNARLSNMDNLELTRPCSHDGFSLCVLHLSRDRSHACSLLCGGIELPTATAMPPIATTGCNGRTYEIKSLNIGL
eukprot:761556-Hanusia_phi.AAC.9